MVEAAARDQRDLYFSFFMFTADLRPQDSAYTRLIIQHIKELQALGYAGFDLPIAPPAELDPASELASYVALKRAFDDAGLDDAKFTTNVAATRTFDPSSPYSGQREVALSYLKSRVDITAALGGTIMAGPLIFPYNVFPTMDSGQPIWSDALHAWTAPRYRYARPILSELAEYAETKGVVLAIEPVDHWETPAPNTVAEVLEFLEGVPSRQIGVCVDSAHVVLSGGGPAEFEEQARRASAAGRIHSVHISAPDRGAVRGSWIPWRSFLEPLLDGYRGPLLIETFNAVPAFLAPLHLTRRKFWVPGEDRPEMGRPSAYDVAGEAIETVRHELNQFQTV